MGVVRSATNRGSSSSAARGSGSLHPPPQRVAAGQAGGGRAAVPQGAVEALPGGERRGALVGVV